MIDTALKELETFNENRSCIEIILLEKTSPLNKLSLMKTEVVLKYSNKNVILSSYGTFNENRSCIEICL